MSDTNPPPLPPPPQMPGGSSPPPAERRHGCATAFLILFGIVLLLPGVCALIFGANMVGDAHLDSIVASFVLLGLLIGLAGATLIYLAVKGR